MAVKRKAQVSGEGSKKRKKQVPKAMAQRHSDSSLLGLPAELRNRIYEYTLTDAGEINIDSGLRMPALLSVCQQIRNESRGIWYTIKEFCITIDKCDSRLLNAFAEVAKRAGCFSIVCHVEWQELDWNNLMEWCRLLWEGKVVCYTHRVRKQWFRYGSCGRDGSRYFLAIEWPALERV